MASEHKVVDGVCYIIMECSCPAGSHWIICHEHLKKHVESTADNKSG